MNYRREQILKNKKLREKRWKLMSGIKGYSCGKDVVFIGDNNKVIHLIWPDNKTILYVGPDENEANKIIESFVEVRKDEETEFLGLQTKN